MVKADVVALAMGDGQSQYLTDSTGARKRRIGALDAAPDPLRPKLERRIAQHCARQQTCLQEHLKTVADPEHQAAVSGEFLDAVHDRREPSYGTRAQMVAVRKATRQDRGRIAIGG